MTKSLYISGDIEASGPIPGDYSMLSIGMSVVGHEDDPDMCFYVELKPIPGAKVNPESMKYVGGLTLEYLEEHGLEPAEAMLRLKEWIERVTPPGHVPVFVAWPAHFDWMWLQWYFIHFLGQSPFGRGSGRALDVRSFTMGRTGLDYTQASKRTLKRMGIRSRYRHTHNALDDAKGQGDLFGQIYERGRRVMRWVANSLR